MFVWNWVDFFLVLVILLSGWLGWRRGFFQGVLDLVVLFGSVLLAFLFYQPLGRLFTGSLGWSEIWAFPAAFLIVLLAAMAVLTYGGGWIVRLIPRIVRRGVPNRLFGILPGFVNGLVLVFVIVVLLLSLPMPAAMTSETRSSWLADRLAGPIEGFETVFSDIFGEAAARLLTLLTIEPESSETVDLPFTVEDPEVRPDLEARMLDLVNREREAEGLLPLEADPELTEVARAHSRDMLARGYFSHITPEGLTPFDRMRDAGVTFIVAGENLALAPTLSRAHNGLMNSPGHRANILRPQFGRVGIGILDAERYGLMVTQNFRN